MFDNHFDLLRFAIRLVVRMRLNEGLVLGQFGGDPVDDGELRHVHVVPVCVEQLGHDAAVGESYLELSLL